MKKDRTPMSTIPGITATGTYGYMAPATDPTSAPSVQAAAAQLAVMETLTSLGSSSPSPLTYNAAGLLSTLQQGTSNTTPAQAAQNALLQVEYAITQTMDSLISGTSSNSSSTDITSLFSLPGTAGTGGLLGNSLPNGIAQTTGSTSAQQAAQNAVLSAQYAVTQALNSLTSGSSSNSSSSGS
jgi:hypothetical protein